MDIYGQRTGNGTGYNGNKGIYFAPLSFPHFGYYDYNSGSHNNKNSYSLYWESRINGDTYARRLIAYSTGLYPQSSENKGLGYSIRCVSK